MKAQWCRVNVCRMLFEGLKRKRKHFSARFLQKGLPRLLFTTQGSAQIQHILKIRRRPDTKSSFPRSPPQNGRQFSGPTSLLNLSNPGNPQFNSIQQIITQIICAKLNVERKISDKNRASMQKAIVLFWKRQKNALKINTLFFFCRLMCWKRFKNGYII